MVDWNTGGPNARFRVLELLKENFAPGDKIVKTSSGSPYVYACGFVSPGGARKLLLVNKRDRDIEMILQQEPNRAWVVDQTTKGDPPKEETPNDRTLTLKGLAVAVISFK